MTQPAEPAEPFEPRWRQRDGTWYVVVLADDSLPGAEVEVVKHDGTVQVVTIAEVGEVERDWEGNLVCFCTPAPRAASPKQHALMRHLAERLAELDPDLAADVDRAADDELLPMSRASELIELAKAVLGEGAS